MLRREEITGDLQRLEISGVKSWIFDGYHMVTPEKHVGFPLHSYWK